MKSTSLSKELGEYRDLVPQPEELDWETPDKIPTEDKIVLAHEETPSPGELAEIIKEQMSQELSPELLEKHGEEIFDVCYVVAEEAIHLVTGEI